jgi:hypothetical protein
MAKSNSEESGVDFGPRRVLYALLISDREEVESMIGYFQDYNAAEQKGRKSGKKYRILSQTI